MDGLAYYIYLEKITNELNKFEFSALFCDEHVKIVRANILYRITYSHQQRTLS
jgi:hypothetical protein